MENPVCTFATPTLLAGDRSLVDVIAHEISHSWAGNLTTNANWQHFWLNEGFCVFIERKIAGRVHGEDARQFNAILGWKALKESIEHFGADNPLTKLVPDLKGVDPDDAFSSVPYEKGFNLLYHLEQVLGGPSVFEPFVKIYYQTFCCKSLTTDEWKTFLYDYVRKHHPEKAAALDKVEWQKWLYEPGMPPIAMPFDTKLANVCYSLAKRWDAARTKSSSERRSAFPASEFDALSSGQKVVFLERLGEYDALTHDMIEDMAAQYGLMSTVNSEIRFRWQQLCLKAAYTAIFPAVVQFITEQGRMKFTRPLYRALSKCGKEGEQLAKETFLKHRDFYHPICAQMVAKDLHLDSKK
jgi:leukotriene-A4 hydrolase